MKYNIWNIFWLVWYAYKMFKAKWVKFKTFFHEILSWTHKKCLLCFMWSTSVLNLKRASPLVAIVRDTIQAPSHIFKSLQLIWRSVVGEISYVSDHQMGFYDFRQGIRIWPPGDMSYQCTIATHQKLWRSQVIFFSENERKVRKICWIRLAPGAWR